MNSDPVWSWIVEKKFEKLAVIRYIYYINRHAGTPSKANKKGHNEPGYSSILLHGVSKDRMSASTMILPYY